MVQLIIMVTALMVTIIALIWFGFYLLHIMRVKREKRLYMKKYQKQAELLKAQLSLPEVAENRDYCENFMINGILRIYEKIAESKGIGFVVDADPPKELDIEDYQLIKVLEAILDEAIEECENGQGEHQISGSIKVENRQLKIDVSYPIADTFDAEKRLEKINSLLGRKCGIARYEPMGDCVSVNVLMFI